MIKLLYPKTLENESKKAMYFSQCMLNLISLKSILSSNINVTRWKAVKDKLVNCELVNFNVDLSFNILNIPNQYVSNLRCGYDDSLKQCYYYVPDLVRCYNSDKSLNYVIRLVEFGNETIPPMNWIRHSYLKFVDSIGGTEE